jgi:hypothetical protein
MEQTDETTSVEVVAPISIAKRPVGRPRKVREPLPPKPPKPPKAPKPPPKPPGRPKLLHHKYDTSTEEGRKNMNEARKAYYYRNLELERSRALAAYHRKRDEPRVIDERPKH